MNGWKVPACALMGSWLLALPAAASQPTMIDWSEVTARGEGVQLTARRSHDTLASLSIVTRWGTAVLKSQDRLKLPRPDLSSLRVVRFPLDIEASRHEYHVHLEFRGADHDARRSACWKKDMELPADSALIRIDGRGVYEVQTQSAECEKPLRSQGINPDPA
jgi:hypothetical protein